MSPAKTKFEAAFEEKVNQLKSFGFPFDLSGENLSLVTSAEFEPTARTRALTTLLTSLQRR